MVCGELSNLSETTCGVQGRSLFVLFFNSAVDEVSGGDLIGLPEVAAEPANKEKL